MENGGSGTGTHPTELQYSPGGSASVQPQSKVRIPNPSYRDQGRRGDAPERARLIYCVKSSYNQSSLFVYLQSRDTLFVTHDSLVSPIHLAARFLTVGGNRDRHQARRMWRSNPGLFLRAVLGHMGHPGPGG